jgi:ATP-dependent DNA helicase RecQ
VDRFQETLQKYWGHIDFRPLQEDIIHSIASGQDTLGLMPTGGGKSITFQVPAMVMEGVCIVVTPLIALMKDQVEGLRRLGIKALAVYSGMTWDEINISLENCLFGDFKFLYCSPERLATDLFREKVRNMHVSMIVVDEAHCISQWGYDFRPSYLRITELRKLLPGRPILALTATATIPVIDDIQEKLEFSSPNVFRTSFERKNLVYLVREAEDKTGYLLRIIGHVKGTGIVYVRNRIKTKEVADFLMKNGISASHYHAGLSDEIRNQRQDDWMRGNIRVIVATNAFGMGIDKPDVRFVVHLDLPDSLEAYFQEAGRAGRDGKKSWAVLLQNNSDKVNLERRTASNFPDKGVIKDVYHALGNYFQIAIGAGKSIGFDFNMQAFCTQFKFHPVTAYASLKFLEREGLIELTDDLNLPSMVFFSVTRDDLYKFQVANEQFDAFIRLLLRSYSGMFSGYVGVDEDMLANRAGIARDQVYQFLSRLQSAHIIKYIPRRKNPVIIYTEERLDERSLQISHEYYNLRKEQYLKRLEAVIFYATSITPCRSQQLLSYFGETTVDACGQCDVCDHKNELDISSYEFNRLCENIEKLLSSGPLPLKNLVDSTSEMYEEDKTIKVVQWLLDNNKLQYSAQQELFWIV